MSLINNNLDIIDKIKEIFVIYILFLYKLEILNIDNVIDIFFGFFKINFNIFEDNQFFLKIINYLLLCNKENKDFLKLSKYITFIYVITIINKVKLDFINLLNNSQLFKNQKKKINLNENDIFNGDLYNNSVIFSNLKSEIEYLKKYVESYEFFGKKNNLFTFGFINACKEYQEIHKNEILNRIILIKNKLGLKLLHFLLHKKNRKEKTIIKIDIYDEEDLRSIDYKELLKYSYKLFNTLNDNLDGYLKDFEFCKYLLAIMISFKEDHIDKITIKLHEKLLKKYVFLDKS